MFMDRLQTGDFVQHFKRGKMGISDTKYCYKIINMCAIHTETNEALVIYQALYDDKLVFARPRQAFLGEVDIIKYPDVTQKYRFEKITDENLLHKLKAIDICESI